MWAFDNYFYEDFNELELSSLSEIDLSDFDKIQVVRHNFLFKAGKPGRALAIKLFAEKQQKLTRLKRQLHAIQRSNSENNTMSTVDDGREISTFEPANKRRKLNGKDRDARPSTTKNLASDSPINTALENKQMEENNDNSPKII